MRVQSALIGRPRYDEAECAFARGERFVKCD